MANFSERHGLDLPDAEITVRHDAPSWLRDLVVSYAYEAKFKPSALRSILCKKLMVSADAGNWTEFPNVDSEVHSLLDSAPWFYVYDLIEELHTRRVSDGGEAWDHASNAVADDFANNINRAFRKKGVGWQLVDGRIQVRGSEVFEQSVRTAVTLTAQTGRKVARHELQESLNDLSRRPAPELTGAIQHAMAALECVARDLTGDPNITLGAWVSKNRAVFPAPLSETVDKLWGYSSQYGRHVKEGHPPVYDEAELVVGLAGALSVYLLRKMPGAPATP